jgi:hypothetical protein
MTISDELITILNRILDESRDEKDIALLRQYIETVNAQSQVQLAKNIVNANEIQGLHIGDRTYYGTDAETIKIALREVLPEIIQSIAIGKSSQENTLLISHPSNFDSQTTSEKFVQRENSETELASPTPTVTTFEFEVVSVDAKGKEIKRSREADSFIENLGDRVVLEMVSIPVVNFKWEQQKMKKHPKKKNVLNA